MLSLFLQLGEGYTPARTGLALAPLSIGMVVAMILSFALVERLGRRLIHVGVVVAAAGMLAHGPRATGISAWTSPPASPSRASAPAWSSASSST